MRSYTGCQKKDGRSSLQQFHRNEMVLIISLSYVKKMQKIQKDCRSMNPVFWDWITSLTDYTKTVTEILPECQSSSEKRSKNYEKQLRKVAKLYVHVANQRRDYLQKLSTAITKQYDYIMVEDLNMRAMANKGFGNGKATMDNGFGVFQVMLAYKLKRKGGKLVVIDKWFPSSQLCNVCGYKNKKVKNLNVHSWICPVCGTEHDRDENAAINILIEGLRILYEEMEAA